MVEANIRPISNTNDSWPVLPSNLLGLTDGAPTDRRGFGFFIHEDANGKCRWEYWGEKHDSSDEGSFDSEDGKEIEDYIEDYVDWMGSDWRQISGVGIAACTVGLVLAIAATIYMCVSHVWPVRYLTAAVAIFIVMPFQFSTMAVMDSDFCHDRDCKLQRSAHFSLAAGFLYLATGVTFFLFRNYPGVAAATQGEFPPVRSNKQVPEVKQSPATLVLEEATHPDVEEDIVVLPHHQHTASLEQAELAVGDGMSEAREVKPQIY